MNNNKEARHAELHKTIWLIANDRCRSVDGWDSLTRDARRHHRYFSTVVLVTPNDGNSP